MRASLPTALYRADQVRELDRLAMVRLSITGAELMERAGLAAWTTFAGMWPCAQRVAVVCGGGNNGGDGYVFARLAREHGLGVDVVSVVPPGKLRGDARVAAGRLLETGIEPRESLGEGETAADVVVDALLGTGLDRAVENEFLNAINALNACARPVFSIDIPSGLHADTGRVMGTAVRSTATLTFIGMKVGLLTGSGPDYTGRILFSDLDVPEEIYGGLAPAARRIDFDLLQHRLGRRRPAAHKGDFGHVLVVGGDSGCPGAARMAAEAAARTGSGLVTVATRAEHAALIPLARPELMARGVVDPADLAPLLERATVVAVGPGLGQGEWGSALLARLLETRLPMVMDADALRLLARDPVTRKNWVLTPHPGEAGALLETGTAEVQADRLAAATALQRRFGGVSVLKGAGSLVASADGLWLCSGGNPGMASGGMGDLLTGIIAGLLAQGYGPELSAQIGVCLHAAAGDRAAEDGMRGLLASDLLPWVRRLANDS